MTWRGRVLKAQEEKDRQHKAEEEEKKLPESQIATWLGRELHRRAQAAALESAARKT